MKYLISQLPVLGNIQRRIYHKLEKINDFSGSTNYWINRYEIGRDSGPGSYNQLALHKAEVINEFVKSNEIKTVIEYGCGDGNQLRYANYPQYTGFDISLRAIKICQTLYKQDISKAFYLLEPTQKISHTADMTLSLDVIFHLVEDSIFNQYMIRLFDSSNKFVCIYSSNTEKNPSQQVSHVKHRKFSSWIDANRTQWKLIKMVKNKFPYNGNDEISSFADFYFYKKEGKDDNK
jgi:SAM-dependent methyltransferase